MNDEQKEAKRRAEVMLAFAEGKKIRDQWGPVSDPVWNWKESNYYVEPPAKRKIVLEAWICYSGELRYISNVSRWETEGWTRLPLLDLATEVDE